MFYFESGLLDIKVPSVRRRKETAAEPENVEKLYCLKIVDRNPQEGIVKVRYIGYCRDYDEWRLEEVVDLNEQSSSNNSEAGDVQFTGPVPCCISVFEGSRCCLLPVAKVIQTVILLCHSTRCSCNALLDI